MARVRLARLPFNEAQLAKLALSQELKTVALSGEQRSGLMGALPAAEALVELWVDDSEAPAARALLERHLARATPAVGEQRCPSCGANSPANFEQCWSCEASLTGATPAAPAPEAPKPPGRVTFLTVFFALTTLALAVWAWRERATETETATQTLGPIVWSWDEQGCLSGKHRGLLVARECDANGDGNFETRTSYDRKGKRISESFDFDEDGVVNQSNGFDRAGEFMDKSLDRDGDGRFDEWETFDRDGKLLDRSFDDDHDGRADRVLSFDRSGALRSTASGPGWAERLEVSGSTLTFQLPTDGGLSELTVERDGGFARKQVLTAAGWVEAP